MDPARRVVFGIDGKARPAVVPDEALADVASDFQVSRRKIKSPKRGTARVCLARDELARRLYEQGFTLREIGEYLCGRDHSTISVAVRRANRRILEDALPEKVDLSTGSA